jgi:hypothetical protein
MKKFKVIMRELDRDGQVREIKQTAHCETRQQVIDFYGLNEPDILDYEITEID